MAVPRIPMLLLYDCLEASGVLELREREKVLRGHGDLVANSWGEAGYAALRADKCWDPINADLEPASLESLRYLFPSQLSFST